jgi:hypothetical protein
MRVVIATLLALSVLACEEEPKLTYGIDAKEHTERGYFPIDNVAVHALGKPTFGGPMSCDSCHGGRNSFKEFKCFECHNFDARSPIVVHQGIAGFVLDNQHCLSCHADGTKGSEQGVATHSERSFPIRATDSHGSPAYLARVKADQDACTACHASVADRTLLRCAECHAEDARPLADAHAALSRSFENDTVACKRCHGETPVNPAVRPLTEHRANFFDPNHHESKCTECHAQAAEPPKQWTTNFAVATCQTCHTNPACSPGNPRACLPL